MRTGMCNNRARYLRNIRAPYMRNSMARHVFYSEVHDMPNGRVRYVRRSCYRRNSRARYMCSSRPHYMRNSRARNWVRAQKIFSAFPWHARAENL